LQLSSKTKFMNIIGLLFGMIGVVIIFIYGPPQPDFNPYSYLIDDTINHEVLDLRDKYDALSKIGLGFIFFGFLLQLVSVVFSEGVNKKSKEKIKQINPTDNETAY
jgi:hypothetical protein